MNKSAAIREVAADMPDASAAEISDEIRERYGVEVTPGSVRAVRSRDAIRGVPASRPRTPRAPRARVRAVREPEPVDYDDEQEAEPVIRPEAEPVDEEQADREFLELYDRVENAIRLATRGTPQQVTGDREFISMIQSIADDREVRAANKPFLVETRDNPDGSVTLRITGQKMQTRSQSKGLGRRKRMPGCEWCTQSGRQSMPGVNLYVVSGGILGRQTILCQMHAMSVITVPGANAYPLTIYDQITGAAVIVPAETPMQRLRKEVMESAGSYFGMGQSLGEDS